jgi:hypothetical protein
MGIGATAIARAPKAPLAGVAIFSSFPVSRERLLDEVGGLEGVFTVFGVHYCRLFADPRTRAPTESLNV